jgi:hypothetical protein
VRKVTREDLEEEKKDNTKGEAVEDSKAMRERMTQTGEVVEEVARGENTEPKKECLQKTEREVGVLRSTGEVGVERVVETKEVEIFMVIGMKEESRN